MQAGLTKAGAEVLHRDIKESVSVISPLSYPPRAAVGVPIVVWSQLDGGGQVLARDDAGRSNTEKAAWQSRLRTCGRYMVSSETRSNLALVQWRGLTAVHRAGHFRTQPKLRN